MNDKTYHAIFEVRKENVEGSLTKTKVSLGCFLAYDSDDEFNIVELAKGMIKNEMWKCSEKEALRSCDKNNVAQQVSVMTTVVRSNDTTLHHFTSNFPMSREMISEYVEMSNVSTDAEKRLVDAIVFPKPKGESR